MTITRKSKMYNMIDFANEVSIKLYYWFNGMENPCLRLCLHTGRISIQKFKAKKSM